MMDQPNIQGVLFDLDGTILDTVHDLVFALNQVRHNRSLAALDAATIRPLANLGSKAMAKVAFEVDEHHPDFYILRNEFLDYYFKHLADSTQFFPEIDAVLTYLEQHGIPWGIVTNKLQKYTTELLRKLSIDHRPSCVVCGDTLSKAKPDPLPILHACNVLQIAPANCLFVGDAETDVMASKAAGTMSLVALYGYIHHEHNPLSWGADGYIKSPLEIIAWIERQNA